MASLFIIFIWSYNEPPNDSCFLVINWQFYHSNRTVAKSNCWAEHNNYVIRLFALNTHTYFCFVFLFVGKMKLHLTYMKRSSKITMSASPTVKSTQLMYTIYRSSFEIWYHPRNRQLMQSRIVVCNAIFCCLFSSSLVSSNDAVHEYQQTNKIDKKNPISLITFDIIKWMINFYSENFSFWRHNVAGLTTNY